MWKKSMLYYLVKYLYNVEAVCNCVLKDMKAKAPTHILPIGKHNVKCGILWVHSLICRATLHVTIVKHYWLNSQVADITIYSTVQSSISRPAPVVLSADWGLSCELLFFPHLIHISLRWIFLLYPILFSLCCILLISSALMCHLFHACPYHRGLLTLNSLSPHPPTNSLFLPL